ncbi:hypothetical protein [Pseudonocardia oceani]|uniref:Uncharacterized protein n=1 Tax=Pseudonocardia oceani TaxID=2792013 RepID=A0ABS6UG53_9PSEU|nr:hypothetical protein [Pseudonocardia oceani]MBW0090522.1 hypothetical protein [Pseudonocardia oceani]MBW0124365.1 hypothetical protein [Pseudonocardia oceani]MBW0131230.1 hypothetical protein [Pseudonocardia oceani]MBW0132603.1 hypothetical protein [Pseudonocardia oceani]
MTSLIVHDHSPTGELPTITGQPAAVTDAIARGRAAIPARPRGGWISEDRPSGRHRADRAGSVHVSAIAGVDLRRRPQRAGKSHGLLDQLLGGGA